MLIKPSASIRQNYNEIATLCKTSGEPVYLTKNGEGDLVVMDIEAFARREKMLKLREELLAIEEDRLTGRAGVTPDELDKYLDRIIDEAEQTAFNSMMQRGLDDAKAGRSRPASEVFSELRQEIDKANGR